MCRCTCWTSRHAVLTPWCSANLVLFVREYRDEGRTVFLSTHVLSEAETLCDRVGIVRAGRLETVASLTVARLRRFTARFGGAPPTDDELPGATVLERRDHELEFEVSGSTDAIIKTLARYEVLDLVTDEPNLEDVFLRFYGEAVPA